MGFGSHASPLPTSVLPMGMRPRDAGSNHLGADDTGTHRAWQSQAGICGMAKQSYRETSRARDEAVPDPEPLPGAVAVSKLK